MKYFSLLVIFFFIFIAQPLLAQKLIVENFTEALGDLDASKQATQRLDNNGVACALIKVYLTMSGAEFRGNKMGSTDFKVNQYWVYLTEGSKTLGIDVPGKLPLDLRFEDYGITAVQSKTTYILTIVAEGTVHAPQYQYVRFQVSPDDALVELDGEIIPVDGGIASKRIKFGNYQYKITADGYHEQTGYVSVFNSDVATEEKVELKPAFGILNIKGDAAFTKAKVYADNKMIGEGALQGVRLSSGSHTIRVISTEHKPFEQKIEIKDGETSTLNVSLVSDYYDVVFSTGDNAEIWINEEKQAIGKWSGRLQSGEYVVEARLAGRKTTSRIVVISSNGPKTFSLETPAMTFGSLDISTSPAGANLSIDGKYIDVTPTIQNNLTTGTHKITVTKTNYKTLEQDISIVADQVTELSLTLEVEKKIEQKEEKKAEPIIEQEPDKPVVEKTKSNTETPKQKSATDFLNPPSFYIGANYQLGGMQGVGINAGMNIKNFNAEIDFVKGFGKSDPLYWSGNTLSQASYEYSANIALGARVGYLLAINDRFRITPQAGVSYVQVNGKAESSSSNSPALDTYAISATIGAKVDFDIVRNFGISVCPEFAFPVSQGGIYKGLAEADSTIKGFASGLNIRAGLYVCF